MINDEFLDENLAKIKDVNKRVQFMKVRDNIFLMRMANDVFDWNKKGK